ncbi:MAG: AAA family ATPase, partial [Pseudodonghicola sp.]
MPAPVQRSGSRSITQAPCILFIDEVDAAGSRFSRDQNGKTYHTQVVNGFLQQIDRLSRDPGVILVGACNQVASLDPAILRPGRFDEIVEMPLPGPEDIVGILNGALKGALSAPETISLAREAVGRTPAELDAAIRAASSDARHSGTAVTADLLRRHLGLHATDPNYLYRIAVHEAGHALVATMLEGTPASKVSIWQGGGVTAHRTCIRHGT